MFTSTLILLADATTSAVGGLVGGIGITAAAAAAWKVGASLVKGGEWKGKKDSPNVDLEVLKAQAGVAHPDVARLVTAIEVANTRHEEREKGHERHRQETREAIYRMSEDTRDSISKVTDIVHKIDNRTVKLEERLRACQTNPQLCAVNEREPDSDPPQQPMLRRRSTGETARLKAIAEDAVRDIPRKDR